MISAHKVQFVDALSKKTCLHTIIIIYGSGFWILKVAKNMLQGPCRSFLSDLSTVHHNRIQVSNTMFSLFIGVGNKTRKSFIILNWKVQITSLIDSTTGNVIGYATSEYNDLHHIFPFTKTEACDLICTDLKSCFFISIILLIVLASFALYYVHDPQVVSGYHDERHHIVSCFAELFNSFKQLKKHMWMLRRVTAGNWVAWFTYVFFNTYWMALEVYE